MLNNYIYFIITIIFGISLLMIIANTNYVRKIIGLNLMQAAILLFYIALGKMASGIPPISQDAQEVIYSNPLPHVLMLTAIVVGFAVSAVGMALIYRIKLAFKTTDADKLEIYCEHD